MTLARRHLVLLVPLAVLAAVAALLPSLPNADYWSRFAARYFLAEDHWQGLRAALWVAENGHRNPLGQLVYLLNYHLLSGSNYGLFAMTALFALATAALLVRALRVARGGERAGEVLVVFAVVLSPAAIFHWVSPMSGTHWLLTDALFAATLWALAHYLAARRRRYAALSCALAMLAAFAFTTGIAALALISVALLLAAPQKTQILGLLAALNAIFYGAYFLFVFDFAGAGPAGLEPARWAAFFLSGAGAYFSAKPFGIAPSMLMGVVMIAAWAWMLRRLARGVTGPALMIGLFGTYALINLALIALGRHDMPLTVSLTTRYGNIAGWLALAIAVGWLELAPSHSRRRLAWASIALLIGAGYLKGTAELAVYHRPFLARAPLDRLAVQLKLPEIPRRDSYVRFPARPRLIEALERAGHVPFSNSDRAIPLGAPAAGGAVSGARVRGTETPLRPGWTKIEFRAPELPDAVDLVDASARAVIGAAVRVGDRHVGYVRATTRAERELIAVSPEA